MQGPVQVLHVEDDAAVADGIRLLLRSAGMQVATSGSAADAMHRIARDGFCPDVLLLDYWLGGELTGADLAERIGRQLGHRVPTIIVSGDLYNTEVPWIPGTPLLLVAKPVDDELLLDTISHFAAWQRQALARSARPGAAGRMRAQGI